MAQDTPVPVVANTEPLTVKKALSLALGTGCIGAAAPTMRALTDALT